MDLPLTLATLVILLFALYVYLGRRIVSHAKRIDEKIGGIYLKIEHEVFVFEMMDFKGAMQKQVDRLLYEFRAIARMPNPFGIFNELIEAENTNLHRRRRNLGKYIDNIIKAETIYRNELYHLLQACPDGYLTGKTIADTMRAVIPAVETPYVRNGTIDQMCYMLQDRMVHLQTFGKSAASVPFEEIYARVAVFSRGEKLDVRL